MESAFKGLEISSKNGDGDDGDDENKMDLQRSPTQSLSLDGPYQSLVVSPSKSDSGEQFQMPVLRKESNVITPLPLPLSSASTSATTFQFKPSSIIFNQERSESENIEVNVNVLSKIGKREMSPDICDFRRKIENRAPINKKNQSEIVPLGQEKESVEDNDDGQSIIVPIVNIIDKKILKEYSLTSAPDSAGQNRILTHSGIVINSISPPKQADAKSQETLLLEQSNSNIEMKAITRNDDAKSEKPIDKQLRAIEVESKSKAKILNEKENISHLNTGDVEVDKNSQDQPQPPSLTTPATEENGNSSRPKPVDQRASYSNSRPKRKVTTRLRYGIEDQCNEPYRRKKVTNLNGPMPSLNISANQPSSSSGMLNKAGSNSKSRQKGKNQSAISQSKGNATNKTDDSQDSIALVGFATTYSDEDKKILYKVGKFVLNKKDAFYDPINRESEDLDIYQIEENRIRLFEGLVYEEKNVNVLFHVSTEETLPVTKEDLYRDYQPIYVHVIHKVLPNDPTKTPHVYTKYFVVDRISPYLAIIDHTAGYESSFAGCLRIVTHEVLSSDGFMEKKLKRSSRYFNEFLHSEWTTLNEAIKVHIDTLIDLLPWNKDLFKLLEKYPFVRKYDKGDREVLPTTPCHFCSLNKDQRSYHDISGNRYEKLNFSKRHTQETIDLVCICCNCETAVYIYSRIYHHIYHVYRVMDYQVDSILENAVSVIKGEDILNHFILDVYFVRTMFLDFQVILAECERLVESLNKVKQAEKIQKNVDKQAKLQQLIEKKKSVETSIPPGPLSVKIKKLGKNSVQAQPTASPSTEPIDNTPATNLVNMPSTNST